MPLPQAQVAIDGSQMWDHKVPILGPLPRRRIVVPVLSTGVVGMEKPRLRVIHGIRQRSLSSAVSADLKAQLTELCRRLPGASAVLPELIAEIERETTQVERWSFWMINVHQHAEVLRLITEKASRQKLAVLVFADILQHLDRSTGAVLSTREEIAARIPARVNHVSTVLKELVTWNVLRKFQNGRQAVWMLNPNIATRLPGEAGEKARKEAGPVLRLVPKDEGGKINDPAQVDWIEDVHGGRQEDRS